MTWAVFPERILSLTWS